MGGSGIAARLVVCRWMLYKKRPKSGVHGHFTSVGSPRRSNRGVQIRRNKANCRGAGIIGAHGSSYTYIDGTPAGGYMIVQETFASRTEYKSITPIIRVDEEGLVVDCSYVRSVDEVDGVAVGRYCGGARIATADALEEAVDDGHMLLFSPRASWLNLLNVGACKNRAGLIYINLYVVRCGAADVGEVTSSVSVKVFSSENKLLLSMGGYELAPDIQASNPRALTFWRLDGDSHHVIVERVLPGGTVLD